jgi:hypothetical protein
VYHKIWAYVLVSGALNSSDWAHHRQVRGKSVNNELNKMRGGGKEVPAWFEAVSRNLEELRTNIGKLNQDRRSPSRNLNRWVHGAARDIRPCHILAESISMYKHKVQLSAIISPMTLIATATELWSSEVRARDELIHWSSDLWPPTPVTQFYTTAIWSLASELSAPRLFLIYISIFSSPKNRYWMSASLSRFPMRRRVTW